MRTRERERKVGFTENVLAVNKMSLVFVHLKWINLGFYSHPKILKSIFCLSVYLKNDS